MNTDQAATGDARDKVTRQADTRTGDDRQAGHAAGMPSGTAGAEHPANNVINPHWQSAQSDPNPPHAGDHAPSPRTDQVGADRGSKGSGLPILSGAGKLADDRPGRNEPKSDHASSSLNTHE